MRIADDQQEQGDAVRDELEVADEHHGAVRTRLGVRTGDGRAPCSTTASGMPPMIGYAYAATAGAGA